MSENKLNNFERLYGNGTLYVCEDDKIHSFEEYNFDVESLRNGAEGDYWMIEGVVVSLGGMVTRTRATKQLKMIIERIVISNLLDIRPNAAQQSRNACRHRLGAAVHVLIDRPLT
jgi:hypothetical protein